MKKPSTPKADVPALKKGAIIERQCLLVDEKGVTWWIDPHSCFLRKVTGETAKS